VTRNIEVSLSGNKMLQQKLLYLHENPVRAGLGYETWLLGSTLIYASPSIAGDNTLPLDLQYSFIHYNNINITIFLFGSFSLLIN